ncbi:preprotein translocase subunit SecE [Bacillus coahuilensis p1.1.43]|uniref:Protein translocase subunit SecE n=1 Tax=Bacillus coahuilensis p1.1.43 TaxID=1150625 RepID=A0A147K5F9_9BACI|nr:preprotein translocase subunit SecE [Bacillus coahuilensis]KUP04805.1 preprotein translocase subunit SecE [Bacillus coahuilensis p1.1.43]
MANIAKFFRNVSLEMKKTSWPKRKELTRYTITVISTVVFVALFFAAVDFGISTLMDLIL